jgi:hypothetical protein
VGGQGSWVSGEELEDLGRGLCLAGADSAQPALMKQATLISRLGDHFPAGKCHWREPQRYLALALAQ